MVNTFLIAAGPEGFQKTADALDRKRLFRQIVEAFEILRVLTSRHHIAAFLQLDKCPQFSGTAESAEAMVAWSRSVSKKYLAGGIVYTVDDKGILDSRPASEVPYHLRLGDRYQQNVDGTLTIWPEKKDHDKMVRKYSPLELTKELAAQKNYDLSAGKRLRTRQALLLAPNRWVPNSWIVYGRGHCYHPACLMWVGHERSLIRYMSVMYATYRQRYPQYKISPLEYYIHVPECEEQHLPDTTDAPWWYYEGSPVILSQSASLRRKLPSVYASVVAASEWDSRGYYWPTSRGMLKWNQLALSDGAAAAGAGCAPIKK